MISHSKKKFFVHQVASVVVAKWNKDVFTPLNGDRFSVAACNNFFDERATGVDGKNFATMVLKCENTGNKIWSFEQSECLSSGHSTGSLEPTFSACFSDAGTNNGVEESLSNYSIGALSRSRMIFCEGRRGRRCAVVNI